MNERFYTVADIAELLKVAPTTVRNLIKSGELSAIQVGNRGEFRVESAKFEEYIARQYAKQHATSSKKSEARV